MMQVAERGRVVVRSEGKEDLYGGRRWRWSVTVSMVLPLSSNRSQHVSPRMATLCYACGGASLEVTQQQEDQHLQKKNKAPVSPKAAHYCPSGVIGPAKRKKLAKKLAHREGRTRSLQIARSRDHMSPAMVRV